MAIFDASVEVDVTVRRSIFDDRIIVEMGPITLWQTADEAESLRDRLTAVIEDVRRNPEWPQ